MHEENSQATLCPWCGGDHPPVTSVQECPPAVPAEPVLADCPYCHGMHPKRFVEQCPLKPPTDVHRLGDTYMEALGRRYGRQWRELMYGSFLAEDERTRRMDEAAITIVSLDRCIQMLNILQRRYVDEYGKGILMPGNPLNLQPELKKLEALRQRLVALKEARHHVT